MVMFNARAAAPMLTRVRFGESANPGEMTSNGGMATLELPFGDPADSVWLRRGINMATLLKPPMPKVPADFRRLLIGLIAGDSKPVRAVINPEASPNSPGNSEWMKDNLYDAFMRLFAFSKVEKDERGQARLPLMDMMALKTKLGLSSGASDDAAWQAAAVKRKALPAGEYDEWVEIGDAAQRHLDPAAALGKVPEPV